MKDSIISYLWDISAEYRFQHSFQTQIFFGIKEGILIGFGTIFPKLNSFSIVSTKRFPSRL